MKTSQPDNRKFVELTHTEAINKLPITTAFLKLHLQCTIWDRYCKALLQPTWSEIAPLGNIKSQFLVGKYFFSLGLNSHFVTSSTDQVNNNTNPKELNPVSKVYSELTKLKQLAVNANVANVQYKPNFSIRFKNIVTDKDSLREDEVNTMIQSLGKDKVSLTFSEKEFSEQYPSSYQAMILRNKISQSKKAQKNLWNSALQELQSSFPNSDTTLRINLPSEEYGTVSLQQTPVFTYVQPKHPLALKIKNFQTSLNSKLKDLADQGHAKEVKSPFIVSYIK